MLSDKQSKNEKNILATIQQARHVSEPVASITNYLLDMLFPPRCSGCNRVDYRWCDRCAIELAATPLYSHPVKVEGPLTAVIPTGEHRGKLQSAVHALKYEQARAVAIPLGKRIAQQVIKQNWSASAVAAVPLHTRRLKERGYNQAQLIAQQVAIELELPDYSGAIHRDAFTRSQVGLGYEERQANVAGAFRAIEMFVRGKTFFLIDDVFTTGATLQACAQTLLDNGAHAVYGLTVTVAV